MVGEPTVERWEGYGYTNIDTIATTEILDATTYDAGITCQLDQTDVSQRKIPVSEGNRIYRKPEARNLRSRNTRRNPTRGRREKG